MDTDRGRGGGVLGVFTAGSGLLIRLKNAVSGRRRTLAIGIRIEGMTDGNSGYPQTQRADISFIYSQDFAVEFAQMRKCVSSESALFDNYKASGRFVILDSGLP